MINNQPTTARGPSRSSVSKALQLLIVVADHGLKGITLSAASNATGFHTATAHRLLNTLVQENFLSFDPYSKLYHLGLMPYEMVANAGQELEFLTLRKQLRPALTAIQSDVGGIVCLCVPSRGESLCIDLFAGESDIAVNTLKVGARRPLGAGAASLALLASLPMDKREQTIAAESERYRKYGELTADIVRNACRKLDEDNFVVNEAVIIPDIGAIAVPIFSNDKLIAAVSVTNTISRLGPERRGAIAETMHAAVHKVGFETTKDC